MPFIEWVEEMWAIPWLRRLLYSLSVFLIALIVTWPVRGFIRKRIHKRAGQNLRADTLSKLLMSVAGFVVWFLAAVQILKEGLGVDVTSILAAAGVLGVAVGFGAQSLVKDVISGFFLLLENQFSVGENVTIDGYTGTVEELGLRSTRIRGEASGILIVPNGAISKVINNSRGTPPPPPEG